MLRQVDKINAYEAVRHELLNLLKSGSLKVGDRLPSEAAMAQAMGVSRPVIREALGSLRAVGLINSRNGSGTYVAATRPSLLSGVGRVSMHELHEARSQLEVPIVRLAARRGSYQSAAELLAAVDAMQRCSDPHAWAELDADFHIALARASGNRVLTELSEHIRASVSEMSTSVLSTERMRRADAEHREICDAVIARDEQRAAQALEAHLTAAQMEAISMYGDEPLTEQQQ